MKSAEHALRDLILALRTLRQRPVFTGVAVVTLSLGIGGVVAVFSMLNGVLLKPLPVREQERVILIEKRAPLDNSLRPFAVLDLLNYQSESRAFENLAGVQYDGAFPYVVRATDQPYTVMASAVSSGFFEVLDAKPAAGRLLRRGDELSGSMPVVVISYGLWQRKFGGNADVIGHRIPLDGSPVIVGVAPRGFDFPKGIEIWEPIKNTSEVIATRDYQPYSLIGRLSPGATLTQARDEAGAFQRSIEASSAGELKGQRVVVVPLHEALIGNFKTSLRVVTLGVVLILLLANVNVANLLLIRGTERLRELAVRSALGASARRLVQQLLAEAMVLAVAGAALGSAMAWWLVGLIVRLAPPELPRLADVHVDTTALGIAIGTAACSTLMIGLAPAVWLSTRAWQQSLRSASRVPGDTRSIRVAKRLLVVTQMAIAMVVLSAGALLTRSLVGLQRAEMGFDASHVTLVRLQPPDAYAEGQKHLALFGSLETSLEDVSGIQGATPVVLAPFVGPGGWDATFTTHGQSASEARNNPTVNLEAVAPSYFSTLKVPILRGRNFNAIDGTQSGPVAIVSATIARRAWPGEEPIGKRIKFGPADYDSPWMTVVGVAGETRYRELWEASPTLYVPFGQGATAGLLPRYIAVRSSLGAAALFDIIRSIAPRVAPGTLVIESSPVMDLRGVPLARPRFHTLVLGAFSLIGLLLAAFGLYGVMMSIVATRTKEIGIRVALGAQRRDVHRLVLGEGMLVTLAGVAVGLVGAWYGTRVLQGLLFDVGAGDVHTLLGVSIVLILTALLACVTPSRRAMRVDPMIALRQD